MIIVVLTFGGILAVVLGSYWVFIVRPEQHSHRELAKRLRVARSATAARLGLVKTAQRLSAIPTVDAALSRGRRLIAPAEGLLEQAGSRITVATLLLSCACTALVLFVVVARLTGMPLLALGLVPPAAWIPVAWFRFQRTRRMLKFEEQFPEALDLLSRGLRAGHAFTTGIAMVADELPPPVGPEFRLLYDQQNYGMPFPDALRAFAARLPLIDARFFATAVLTQREAGGNLSEVLDNLASVIRARFKVKRQVRVISAHGRLTGLVLTAVPPALALVLFMINPDHWNTLVGDPLGVRLIYLAVFLQITGGLIIRKLIRIEY